MGSAKRSVIWIRLGCAGVSVAALFLLLHRLKIESLIDAFRRMHRGWFLAAIALYGLAFLPATWRWHLVLRLTGVAVHPGATGRVTLIGHFFYTILFGAVGGDAAKAALYAKWYRWPLPTILATAPLDRLLGFAGLILMGLFALLWKTSPGIFDGDKSILVQWASRLGPLIIVIAVLLVLLIKFPGFRPGWRTFKASFFKGAKRLARSPGIAISGVLCGLLVQLALNGALALNLQAVSHGPLPWRQFLWTLPVIAIASGLPITVAGLGTREGAALALFGIYGINEPEAVAASLLTFAVSIIWAAAGGLLWWRESRLQRKRRPVPQTISIIIPTLNEAESIRETMRRARAVPEVCEIIVADGGSLDRTRELAAELGGRVVPCSPGRGGQLARGASIAKGDVVLLLHADTWMPPHAGVAMVNCMRDVFVVGGGFWKVFRNPRPLLLGSRLKCALRLYVGGRIVGDQAMFIRREVLNQVGGVPDMPLMEEFELCRRLRRCGRLALADATVETSARRFDKRGILRTYALMWRVMLRYYLGAKPDELRKLYEKD